MQYIQHQCLEQEEGDKRGAGKNHDVLARTVGHEQYGNNCEQCGRQPLQRADPRWRDDRVVVLYIGEQCRGNLRYGDELSGRQYGGCTDQCRRLVQEDGSVPERTQVRIRVQQIRHLDARQFDVP